MSFSRLEVLFKMISPTLLLKIRNKTLCKVRQFEDFLVPLLESNNSNITIILNLISPKFLLIRNSWINLIAKEDYEFLWPDRPPLIKYTSKQEWEFYSI